MATGKDRVLDLAEARSRHAADEAHRKAIAKRAWEGGEATVKEIAQAARADPKTVRKWALEENWRGGSRGRAVSPPAASEGGSDHLRNALRLTRGKILGDEGGT